MSWDWRKILEVLILGQFVIDKVLVITGFNIHISNIYNFGENSDQTVKFLCR